MVNDSPKEIYNNPKEKYVAALFDDVNEVVLNGETVILYPHQIKIVESSNLQATVSNSYFKGAYWLIEAEFKNQVVFLNHVSNLEKGTFINLQFVALLEITNSSIK